MGRGKTDFLSIFTWVRVFYPGRNSGSGSDFDQLSDLEPGSVRAEERAHAKTRRQLEICRQKITDMQHENLETTKQNESYKRKICRLERSNSDLLKDKQNSEKKISELETALIDMTEKFENEVRRHKATQDEWSKLNNRHSVNMQVSGQK